MATASIADWYAKERRDLPWRRGRDPYRVWIAEIMLQQTRIEAVIPYYERFMREVPDVKALADIAEDKLLKLWEGLGYYSRARNLKKSAQLIVSEYDGALPDTAAALRTLPGIGDYTAGAIASIAFGQPEPAVDGNVMRVMMRLFACSEDVLEQKNRRAVTQRLRAVYPQGEAAALLTEGLMELGERICLPNAAPLCALCPAASHCAAHRAKAEQAYPVRSAKKERRIEEKTVLLLQCGERFALHKRPEEGLLAGLWGFPLEEGHPSEEEILALLRRRGLAPQRIAACSGSRHIFTHIEWRMSAFHVFCERETNEYVWVTPEEILRDYPIPTAFKAYKKLLAGME